MSRVLDILSDLVRINSINPAYDNGRSERDVADYAARFFAACGVETWEQEVFPGRPNLIARLPGRTSRRIVLEAHMDTASINGMTIPPFEPEIRDGLMYGRGSCDTKAGLAGMMDAVASLQESRVTPECEVWLCAAADEEYSFRGVMKLCENIEAAAAIVAEPTELRAVIATKGVLRWKIHTRGRAAHSSKPQLGVNAIEQMAHVVHALREDARGLNACVHPLLGAGTLNIGVIRGGVQVNFVPDHCEIEIDRRLLPGESVEACLTHYDRLLTSLPDVDAWVERPPMLADEALETPAESAVARVASAVLESMGLKGAVAGVPYGSDASKLARAGVAAIVFGPGSIDQAHAAVEWVECAQVEKAAEFYRRFIMEFA